MNFENFSQNSFKIFFLDLKYKTRFLNSHLHFSIKKIFFVCFGTHPIEAYHINDTKWFKYYLRFASNAGAILTSIGYFYPRPRSISG